MPKTILKLTDVAPTLCPFEYPYPFRSQLKTGPAFSSSAIIVKFQSIKITPKVRDFRKIIEGSKVLNCWNNQVYSLKKGAYGNDFIPGENITSCD